MKLVLLSLGLITAVCFAVNPTNINVENNKSATSEYRLNELVEQIYYYIEITPYLDDTLPDDKAKFTFDGVTKIQLKFLEEKITLKLNSRQLNITEVKISNIDVSTNENPITVDWEHEITFETIVLTFSDILSKNVHYELQFIYSGQMDTDMRGFYRSSYNENDEVEWLGATQLQPTHARRVFPCFDEPHYKAKFKLTLHIPPAYEALSNTNPESIDKSDDRTTYIFYETPIMSTYLLGFIVAKFQMRSDTGNDVYKLAIYSRPGQYNLTEYPLIFGKESLKHLDEYLGIKFEDMGTIKMDMVALPDFASGAMENWGLLTYKELYLLYDETFSTDLDKREIALTIAHEQAHQWFGDLVTCDTWSNTWLNEGFATYFEFFITAAIEPQWELEKTFITDTVHRALVFDSQDGTHALSNPDVNTPDEISAMFSLVSYQKGGSIIRMIEHFIGLENFKTGLRNYLKDYSYKIAQPEYLLKYFKGTQITSDNITDIFMPWITQPGYPVLTVSMDKDRKIATLTQNRFLLNKRDDNSKWSIPLTYTTNNFNNLQPSHVFKSDIDSYTITIDAPNYLIFNVQQSGFYRVQYDNVSWTKISDALKAGLYGGIHEVNRAQIVDDLLNFGQSNDLEYDFIFEILLYLKNEVNYLPWQAAFTGFAVLNGRLNRSELEVFRKFIIELTKKIYTNPSALQQPSDTQLEIYLREKLIHWNCKSYQSACVFAMSDLFNFYAENDGANIPVDFRTAVICHGIKFFSFIHYDIIWSRYKSQQIASEQIILLKGMGCIASNMLIRHLDNIFSTDVRMQDKRTAFQATYTQFEENLQDVLNYLIERHVDVVNSLGSKATFIGYLIGLVDRFTLQIQIEQLKTFQINNEIEYSDFKGALQSAIDKATKNLEWNAKYIPVMIKFMADHLAKLDDGDDNDSGNLINTNLSIVLLGAAFNLLLMYKNVKT